VILAPGTSDETVLTLPVAVAAEDGQKIVVGIRPEHMSRAAGDATNTLNCTVSLVEPTGSETHVSARFGGQDVIAKFFPNQAPALGEVVKLDVDVGRMCVFDAETQRAIR
jgi:multiple sugar transport system ATP-binding protein